MFAPNPGKEKAPKQRACPRRPGPRPGRPRGRGEPAVPHLPRRPAPTPFFPAAEAPAGAPARGWRGRGAWRLHLSSSVPFSRGRGALTPPPASLSHRRRPPFPAAQPTLALTWFKSSHKTRTASRVRPLGAASTGHWLSPRSWARPVGKEPITIGRPSEGGAREKNNSLAASSLSPPPSDSRTTPIRLKYTERKRGIPPPGPFFPFAASRMQKSPAKLVINFRTQRKITVVHR